ncbi:MAG: hypothetical protein JSV16_06535 [Candidatus Hydrogenedentota bacterium]|nr:MAG: hypothetical protein JSV16_06535 [Candidatus Hydrogenedentota bacterium]
MTTRMEASKQPGPEEEAVMRLLPVAGEAEGWKPAGEPESFRGEALYEHIDGGADIYFEYGFVTLVTQRYKKDEKSVSVEIYRMEDTPAAFGIYSYNCHPLLSPVEAGSDGTIHSNGLFFWQDRYYVDVRQLGAGTIFKEEFLAVANAIGGKIGAEPEAPAIMKLLPRENMVPRSEVFARGQLGINNQVYVADEDLFGLKDDEVAAIARYKIGQPECSIIIAEYASGHACQEAFLRLREHFLGSESAEENEFVAAAMPAKYHAVRRTADRLVVVANADSRNSALGMLERTLDTVTGE